MRRGKDPGSMSFDHTGSGVYRVSGLEGAVLGVAGRKAFSADYAANNADPRREEKGLLERITGIARHRILMLNQVHEDTVITIERQPSEDLPSLADADAMITPLAGVCLLIRTADCVPVFAWDPVRGILGAAHCGWKGCRLSLAGKLVEEMREAFRSEPRDIRAVILPSIGPESYAVNEDVALFFEEHVVRRESRLFLDLRGSVAASLMDAGVPAGNIFATGICNYLCSDEFFSHRRGDTGRNLNFGYMV